QPAEWFARAGLPHATSLACLRQERRPGKADLRLPGRPPDEHDVFAVARRLIQRLDEEYARLCDGDFAALESCWKRRLGLLGKTVRAQTHAGAVHEGRLHDISFASLELVSRTGDRLHMLPERIKQVGEW